MKANTASPDAKPITSRKRLGDAGEDAACSYLRGKGFRIVTRNWRKGSLELDVVCRDKDTLVFVEVRTRSAGGKLTPTESFGPSKQRSFLRAVRAYLAETGQWTLPCRCDLVSVVASSSAEQTPVTLPPSSFTVEYCPHVLDCSALDRSVGGGHTAWQPW